MTTTVQRVHDLYWNSNINCARAMLACLGEAFGVTVAPQTFHAAVGMHGAGRFRAQCGLVEGALMFHRHSRHRARQDGKGHRNALPQLCRSLHGAFRLPALPRSAARRFSAFRSAPRLRRRHRGSRGLCQTLSCRRRIPPSAGLTSAHVAKLRPACRRPRTSPFCRLRPVPLNLQHSRERPCPY